MVRQAMIRRPRIRNPHVLIAQPNPCSLIKCVTMIGKMTPPILDPVARMPNAAPVLLSK
jgi:hypothetical protein